MCFVTTQLLAAAIDVSISTTSHLNYRLASIISAVVSFAHPLIIIHTVCLIVLYNKISQVTLCTQAPCNILCSKLCLSYGIFLNPQNDQ